MPRTNGGEMSYESTAEPIKIGYLMDFKLPPRLTRRRCATTSRSRFDLVFERGARSRA